MSGPAILNLIIIRPLGRAWEINGTVRHFLDDAYADPASSQHAQDVIPQNGIAARIGLRLKLWTK